MQGAKNSLESVRAVSAPPEFWKKTGAEISVLTDASLTKMSVKSPLAIF